MCVFLANYDIFNMLKIDKIMIQKERIYFLFIHKEIKKTISKINQDTKTKKNEKPDLS